MANECLDQFNERSTVLVTVAFTDDDGDPVTPSAAFYRIDDLSRRTNILPSTSITPLGTSVELEITSEQNRILRPRSVYEIRVVTVEWDYGAGRHGTAQYRYKLLNLYGVVDVPSASVSPSASASPSA